VLRTRLERATLEKAETRPQANSQKDVADLKQLLFTANMNPLIPVTILYEKSRMSREKGNRMKGLAIKHQLAIEESIQMERMKGKTVTCLILTEKTYKFLGIVRKTDGKGGDLHCTLQQLIHTKLKEMGLDPKIEFNQNGKQADVGFHINGRLWAVEVVITTAKIEHINLQKDLQAGFNRITFVTKDTKVQKMVSEILKESCPSADWGKIHVCLCNELFDLVKREIESTKQ
jgi:hypothetical protein